MQRASRHCRERKKKEIYLHTNTHTRYTYTHVYTHTDMQKRKGRKGRKVHKAFSPFLSLFLSPSLTYLEGCFRICILNWQERKKEKENKENKEERKRKRAMLPRGILITVTYSLCTRYTCAFRLLRCKNDSGSNRFNVVNKRKLNVLYLKNVYRMILLKKNVSFNKLTKSEVLRSTRRYTEINLSLIHVNISLRWKFLSLR